MSILITLLALGIVIFVHELGHMMVAKWSGIGVIEFAIGMGPKVVSRKWGETTYSLRAFPLGGFVKLAGMDDEKDPDPAFPPEKSFLKAPMTGRFLTILAGSVMNIILGFVVFVLMFSLIGIPIPTSKIRSVVDGGPAHSAGLQVGDKLVAINERPIADVQKDMVQVIGAATGKPLNITFERNGSRQTLVVEPAVLDGASAGRIGIRLESEKVRHNPIASIGMGLEKTGQNIKIVFSSLGMLVTGQVGFKDLAGPIGIVQVASNELNDGIREGMLGFLNIMALISISLGVINLFPFPVLDGGHLVFLTIEAIRRRPVNKKWENIINNVGAAMLITLMLAIILNDILNWGARVQLLR